MTIEQPLVFSMNIMGRDLKYVVFADDGVCVARCLDVEVTSDGDTKDDAIANLREALELYFEGLSRDYKEIQVGYHHTPS